MWMSNVLIVVDRNNPDHNSITDLAAAVKEAGASIIEVDEHNLVIEADMPTHEVVVVAAMDGVAYVRSVFSYFKDLSPKEEAA
jgi:seryl-tRNA(Sec) selenium transferase